MLNLFSDRLAYLVECQRPGDEKMNRKWIMVDSSKLAIYTMIKRLLSMQKPSPKGKGAAKLRPFVLYNAGLYENHDSLLELEEEQYISFAMELFQAEHKPSKINGLSIDGYLFNCPVKVFSQKGFLTEEYIDEVHQLVGEYLDSRLFLIAPVTSSLGH